MSVYDVEVTRDGRWWIANVAAIGGVTQARRYCELEPMVRELIELTTGDSDATLRIAAVTVGDVQVMSRLRRIREGRDEAARLEREASAAARTLASDLAARGVSLRDIGGVLGVSHQRAHQLVSE